MVNPIKFPNENQTRLTTIAPEIFQRKILIVLIHYFNSKGNFLYLCVMFHAISFDKDMKDSQMLQAFNNDFKNIQRTPNYLILMSSL